MTMMKQAIAVVFTMLLIYFVFNTSSKEGFVKYYQASSKQEEDTILAPNNDNGRSQSEQYVPNSRKNLVRTFETLGVRNAKEIAALSQELSMMHDGVIDVLALRDALVSSLIPDMNRIAAELATNSEYSLSGNPQDIVVKQSSVDDKKMVKATVEIHDTSILLWTGYTTTVRVTFWLLSGNRVVLMEANIMERNTDQCSANESSCPAYNDLSQKKHPEELLSKFHLVFPWDTSEQKNGLAITEKEKQEELARRNSKATEENFYCFGVAGVSPSSPISREECTRRGGVIDMPVYDSSKCQFFMANKNYPNQRGGSKYGYCEGPLGAVQTSFSRWDPNPAYAPLCYNCKAGVALNGAEGGLGPCCEDQKANLTEYNLLTPDYAFPGDMFDRRQFASDFKARGLSWHRLGKEYEKNLRK